jgi:error-prone DNA polymerase
MQYTELQVTSNFTFLRGGSHPEELVKQAAQLGYSAIAITDRNTLAGIVRGHAAGRIHSVRLIVGCRLELLDGSPLLAYPTDLPAYARLSTLLSEGNLRAEKGSCYLYKADIYKYSEGIKFVAIPPDSLNTAFEFEKSFHTHLQEYRLRLGKNLYLAANRSYLSNDAKRMFRLAELSEQLAIPLVATNDVHYHIPERRELQDILTCIREKCTIQKCSGFSLNIQKPSHRYRNWQMLASSHWMN